MNSIHAHTADGARYLGGADADSLSRSAAVKSQRLALTAAVDGQTRRPDRRLVDHSECVQAAAAVDRHRSRRAGARYVDGIGLSRAVNRQARKTGVIDRAAVGPRHL